MDRETSTKVFRLDLIVFHFQVMFQCLLLIVSSMGDLASYSYTFYQYSGHQIYNFFYQLQIRKKQMLSWKDCNHTSFDILADYCVAVLTLCCWILTPWCGLRWSLGLCCSWGCAVLTAVVYSCPIGDSLAS